MRGSSCSATKECVEAAAAQPGNAWKQLQRNQGMRRSSCSPAQECVEAAAAQLRNAKKQLEPSSDMGGSQYSFLGKIIFVNYVFQKNPQKFRAKYFGQLAFGPLCKNLFFCAYSLRGAALQLP